MDWDKLKTFHAAADAGSLTGAAETLGLSQSAVSRQISALEAELEIKLFHRHARGLLLTEPGRLLFEAAGEIANRVAVAEARVQDSRDKPTGALRITAPTALGSIWLIPRLKQFQALYPKIQLKLLLADHELDLAGLEADIAIRPWPSTQNDLVQRRLMQVEQHLYAAPEYLAKHGTPETLADLDKGHRFIAYGPKKLAPIPNLNWQLTIGHEPGTQPRAATIEANTIKAMMRATEAGFGICGLPDYVAVENPGLVRVLPDTDGPTFDVYVVFPEELKGSRRVAAFRDFLVDAAKAWKAEAAE
ncbi:LysR family transcriptional regulator [Glycocaulis alkaliphilus]|uniref:LysR family transcriptional regulator n=1 Tax=Glycocaulis alkaliphilus TaxID=1434191 RepID=A0A3T0E8N0_9PROT|nr:LysR family transcriptional regulator [Glycocaulis alkaliphilus]AZU03669.1 LysR family transcriptional regulator [Glycocaulis alkaliphilus]GGB83025.1 LysR family transcriptional regulator [Glycocaulis alkaliphilus]